MSPLSAGPANTIAPLRIGMIGAGGIAKPHAAAWRRLGAPLTVFSHGGASALVARYGGTRASSLDELLDSCDVVDIVSPNDTHAEYALASIQAGRHVICEKPVAPDAATTRAVAAAADATGMTLFPAFIERYHPAYRRMLTAVRDGRIGRPAVTRLTRTTAHPPIDSWLADDARSGGVIADLMIHDADLATQVSGPVEHVFAVHTSAEPGVVTVFATLTHASTAITLLSATWGAQGTPFSSSFSVAGEHGTIEFDSVDLPELTMSIPGMDPARAARHRAAVRGSFFYAELADFHQAAATGRPAAVTAADAVAAIEVIDAVRSSLQLGIAVDLAAPASWGYGQ
ncbi:MAG: Gfo/Idh/MocA family oxidoreductase [Propionibacteriaceae bacterium]|nr:Gfo/Idh/MocA family oxidoreductase [Propionibacteriaceae bacterium]